MSADLVACGSKRGTRAGYAKHRRAGEPACAPCKAGNNQETKHRSLARSRALTRLKDMHPADYAALIREELQQPNAEATR